MKLSMNWLSEYIDIGTDIKSYCDAMTMSGSKVEGYAYLGEEIQNVVVGKVLDITKHPDADKLVVCSVDTGGGKLLTIVTGATNVSAGDLVPVALDRSLLPGGKKITKGKLRGVMSEGMLCSISELGLTLGDIPYAIEDGILILQEECKPGQDIRQVLGFDDTVVEFEITSNRPDCLSVRGLARESAATFGKKIDFAKPAVRGVSENIAEHLKVSVDDETLCPRYTARMVKNIKIGPSPKWMRERLRASGIRPINNIVDITNYVMLEYGQPMHAFDFSCVQGGQIVVRTAKDAEVMETLDGQPRKLSPSMLVIADKARPIGVAGVMGGANSEITQNTHTVVFESANFNGTSIRQTAIALGMRTDASGRFEKGLDPENTIPSVDRACELVELLGAGDVLGGMVDVNHTNYAPIELTLEPDRINALLGTQISVQDMRRSLDLLGFSLNLLDFPSHADNYIVPSWRGDVQCMADLAEEVARLYGYDKIPSTLFGGAASGGRLTDKQKAERQVSQLCRAMGYSEIMSYSFISPGYYDAIRLPESSPLRSSVTLLNPLGEDTSVMRTTALPSMLESVARNYSHRSKAVQLFELAHTYLKTDEKLPTEKQSLVLGAYGAGMDFYRLKGHIEALLIQMNIPAIRFKPESGNPSYHPGRCAAVCSGSSCLGVLGQIHPLVQENYGTDAAIYAAELDFDELLNLRAPEAQYKPLPRFPAVSRDIAIVCDAAVPVGRLIDCIRQGAGKLLEEVSLFDLYTGSQIEKGKKSAAFSLVLRATDRTLTDAEADKAVQDAVKLLESSAGAVLRS